MEQQGASTMKVKQVNKNKVYHFIYEARSTSKQYMTQHLNMGLSTVTQNIKTLEQEGLICRNGYFESTGGRKADILMINPTAKVALGGAVLKHQFHWVATNLYGEPVATKILDLPFSPTEAYYDKIVASCNEFVAEHSLVAGDILGVSIATQGLLSEDGLHVSYGKILDNTQTSFAYLTEQIPYPCTLIHDSKAAAQLELWHHKEVQEGMVLMLNLNFGGAVVSGGKVLQGLHGRSGTVEHMSMNQDGPLCYCGKRGCLESYCSVEHLEQVAQTDIHTFFKEKSNNPTYQSVWTDYLNYLSYAIRNLSVIIDGTFMLSGYLAPHIVQEDLDYILEKVNSLATFPLEASDLVLGTYGTFSQALGASLQYIQGFLNTLPTALDH